jgi:hypothetical protein
MIESMIVSKEQRMRGVEERMQEDIKRRIKEREDETM